MAKNADLNKAAKAKKDEFYTQLTDIEKEMRYYRDYFKDKIVFCNCDDPFESNFFKYFAMNFNSLGLKKLITTCYATSPIAGNELDYYAEKSGQISFLPVANSAPMQDIDKKPYRVEITEVSDENGDGRIDLADVEYLIKNKKNTMSLLEGDGDFRSTECVELLKESDVVVTNPPFSLFREFLAELMKYGKDFLIIGNINAITYKEVFPLIMQNKMWLGASIHSGDREFRVPDSYPLQAAGYRVDENGTKYIRVKGVRWFTNLDYAARHEDLILYKHYTPEEYPHYDNYDAIEVSKTTEIPCDYFSNMGVPITYMDRHNPDQFEIVGTDYQVAESVDLGNGKRGTGRFYLQKELDKPVDRSHALTDRQTDRQTQIIQPYRYQTQDLTALWASRSHSLTDIALTNSNLSEQPKVRERDSQTDYGMNQAALHSRSLMENGSISAYLSDVKCNGVMGVPITFLDKYNPDQFEIIGMAKRGAGDPSLKSKVYTKKDYPNYSDLNATPVIIQPNGKPKNTYPRILIRRKQV